MLELRRIRAGIFKEDKSVNLYDFTTAVEECKRGNEKLLREIIIPAEIVSKIHEAIEVKKGSLKKLFTGKPIFQEDLKEKNAIVAESKIEHSYPHGQRSHKPVIFRTTKQWFFKIEDIKEKMIKENNEIKWVPKAGYNAFNSWL